MIKRAQVSKNSHQLKIQIIQQIGQIYLPRLSRIEQKSSQIPGFSVFCELRCFR